MKIVFLSNYFNHHQKFLSDSLDAECDKYRFIATSKMRDERKKLGYGGIPMPQYIVDISEREMEEGELEEIKDCDALITGSAPESYIEMRQKERKLVFRYSERIYKTKAQWYKWPFRLFTFYKKFGRHRNTYLLCSSAFTYLDYAKHGAFINKAYKWGYFPETKKYDSLQSLMDKKSLSTILWCGRLIDWKHPDDAIAVVNRLKKEGYKFELNIIGTGDMESFIRGLIAKYNLFDCVHLLGSMKPEQVRTYMEQAQIYLFTSDRQEGWGAVLNEAMNSGCAVVASHAIGATPFLVTDGENGLIYKSGNISMLYEKVKYLLDNVNVSQQLGKNAYQTIINEWNAEEAAKRFINLSEHILAGEKRPNLYKSGPCSKAKILNNGWYRSR